MISLPTLPTPTHLQQWPLLHPFPFRFSSSFPSISLLPSPKSPFPSLLPFSSALKVLQSIPSSPTRPASSLRSSTTSTSIPKAINHFNKDISSTIPIGAALPIILPSSFTPATKVISNGLHRTPVFFSNTLHISAHSSFSSRYYYFIQFRLDFCLNFIYFVFVLSGMGTLGIL